MRRHAKASSAGSTSSRGNSLGSLGRGALATGASSSRAAGTGAPSHRSAPRARLASLALAIGALALLALAPAASAAPTRHNVGSYASPTPNELTVDNSNGDVYVIDQTDGIVSRYDSQGKPKAFTCGSCTDNTLSGFFFFGSGQVAVDDSSGRIYVANLFGVNVFDSTGEPITTLDGTNTVGGANGDGAFGFPAGVAVDQSNGKVYVADANDQSNGILWRYTPSAGTISNSDYSGGIKAPGPVFNVAAAKGTVYASDTLTGGETRAFHDADFAAPANPPNASAPSTLIASAATAIDADPSTADVYLDTGSQVDVYDSSGAALYSFGTGDFSGSGGVAVGSFGANAYVADPGGQIDVYGPLPQPGTRHNVGSYASPTPNELTVDNSNGDVYVIDQTDGIVSRYDSQGKPKAFTCGSCTDNTLSGFFFFGSGQVAVDDSSGRIYVANLFGVNVFDSTGEPITTLDGTNTVGGANGDGAFGFPAGVAVDQSNGKVYVADANDQSNGILWRYTPSAGTISNSDYSGGIKAPGPVFNVAAAKGTVYASDTLTGGETRAFHDADFAAPANPPNASAPSTLIASAATAIDADPSTADVYLDTGSQVDVYDSSGAALYSFGTGDFSGSGGVAVGSFGANAYVADPGGQIDVYGPLPQPGTRHNVGSYASPTPNELTVDNSNGDVYVIDQTDGIVSRYDSQGKPKAFTCGSCTDNTLSGFFFFGSGQVAVDDSSGRIYVANLFGVNVFDSTGEPITTLDGTNTVGGANGDGAFGFPAGVAVDQSNGKVYVADANDQSNGILWRYTPSAGTISNSDYSGGIKAPGPVFNVAAAKGTVYASDTLTGGETRAFHDADFAAPANPPNASAPSTLIASAATAIDADPSTADVYLDTGSQVDVYDSTGAALYSFCER